MIFVTKFDGRRQPFDKSKIITTCLRLKANLKQAQNIANQIEKEAYDGIPTSKILELIFSYLKEVKPEIKYRIDLREAISRLRPKPDFELFVAMLLKEYGYSVQVNQIVEGKCVSHEIDAIAVKNGETIFVEVKHHLQPHTYTGVDVMLETQARLEDLKEGFKLHRHGFDFSKALVICNTKFSDHALQYAECKGISYIGWKAPPNAGLEKLIEEKKLYPITLLKSLDFETEQKLGDVGIVTLNQLLQHDIELLHERTKIPKNKLRLLFTAARKILA
ncbi:MAG: ATP cone domain-containing protein [Candidatus Aenigmatarchaeota archaeon]